MVASIIRKDINLIIIYNHNILQNLENISTDDPREVWAKILKKGCRKINTIPIKVYNENDSISTNINTVLFTWKGEFKALFNNPDNIQFDNAFFEECINANREKEVAMERQLCT